VVELLLYLALAVGVSFICSILEAVLLSTTFTFIETQVKNGVKGSKNLQNIKSNMDTSIGSILTLNTMAHTFGAAGVGAQAQYLFGDEYTTAVSIILTLLILYLSEIIPKTLGATYWKSLAIPSAYVIQWLVLLTKPFNFISTWITSFVSSGKNHSEEISRDEILTMVSKGRQVGVVSEKEEVIVRNILRLYKIKVKDVLTPRKVVFALRKDATIDEILSDPAHSKKLKHFSRIPIYHGSKDYIEGIVFSQTLFEESNEENEKKRLSEISIPVFEINENINLSKALDLFIQRKEHMFIVKDSYSQTAGVVTLEDVIETLLGREIMDELDTIEDMQKYAKIGKTP
jgi:CBS domain containing-hemolysin-like protein